MNTDELRSLAERSRTMRETGFALLFASGVLGLFLLVGQLSPQNPAPVSVAPAPTPDAYAKLTLEAKAAIVYDLTTGETLYAKNADTQLPLASLTKILTVYAAVAAMSPDTEVTIPDSLPGVEAPLAFNAGQIFSLSDLAKLTLTASLNDGAAAIAVATAERTHQTQNQMLASAATGLHLSQTYAVNGSGLDVNSAVSGGYGSARDLAQLAGALVAKAPEIASATTEATAEASSVGGTSFTVKNTDPIVHTIPGLLLSKTGYTDLAGGNLALVFDVGVGHPISIVVLGSSKGARFTDSTALVEATFAHFAGVSSL